jgi:hypothetical protein
VPIIVGASAAGLDNLAAFSRRVVDAGAAGVMVAPVPGLRSDEQVYGYFEQVAARLGDIPWVLQDSPQTTTVFMSPGGILKMIADFPNLVMVKHEDWPGLAKITKLRDAERAGAWRDRERRGARARPEAVGARRRGGRAPGAPHGAARRRPRAVSAAAGDRRALRRDLDPVADSAPRASATAR